MPSHWQTLDIMGSQQEREDSEFQPAKGRSPPHANYPTGNEAGALPVSYDDGNYKLNCLTRLSGHGFRHKRLGASPLRNRLRSVTDEQGIGPIV